MNCSRTKIIAGLLVLAATGLVLWFAAGRRPPPAPAPEVVLEVPLQELVVREGRSFRQEEEEPFEGIAFDTYPDGAVKSRSTFARGVLHGVSEGWHTNGTLQVREHFKEGVSDGVRTKWYENGRKLSEATISRGKILGTFRRWHEDGALAEDIEMKDGNPDGFSRAYYPSGFLKAEALLRAGEVIENRFWKDGERQAFTPVSDESVSVGGE